jgi:trans-aconitate 2-methyltransferase
MPWNPETYNQFKEERYQPFYDLISHIHHKPGMKIIDLGCGTGELTKILADKFKESTVLGIDASAEMLSKAPQQKNLRFLQSSIEKEVEKKDSWNLIVANASLQWVENHHQLFPTIFARLSEHGQVATQMPSQKENKLNQILHSLAHEDPFYQSLQHTIRESPLLSLDDYTSLFFSHGAKEVVIYQKVYPLMIESTDSLYDFISGTALIPYMENLSDDLKSKFKVEFKNRIAQSFTSSPIVYAFKRIILYGQF